MLPHLLFTLRSEMGKDVPYSYRHTVVITIRPFTVQATVTTWAITVFYNTSAITDSSILTYKIYTVLTATPCNNQEKLVEGLNYSSYFSRSFLDYFSTDRHTHFI